MAPKSFYQRKKGPTKKELTDLEVTAIICSLQEAYGNSLGYRKMKHRLNDDYGIKLGEKKILKLMGVAKALSAVRRKHFSEEYYLTRRELKDNAPPDLIHRDFFALEPRMRFVCDITYLIGCDETWYLNTIEDLFNGEVLAWMIGEHCNTALCVDTVELLRQKIGNTAGVIIHTDAGSTYNSYAYRELLLSLGIRQSMGTSGDCFDNARIESFNAVFKTEALYAYFGKSKVTQRKIPVRSLAARAEWFIPLYNDKRRKEALGGKTPVEYRILNPKGTYPVCIEERN